MAAAPQFDFAAQLRAARTAAGISQTELARRAGTSQPAIARYEGGRTAPTTRTLSRLFEACRRAEIAARYRARDVDTDRLAETLGVSAAVRLRRLESFVNDIHELREGFQRRRRL
ncbi:MAG: hypothetical protein QOE92_2483 [Chloroflexota bacterium]|nr:hypothetical protein [Chloroflexota bacterium]